MLLFSFFLSESSSVTSLLSWNRRTNEITDCINVLTPPPRFSGDLLAVDHSRSDIEMSNPFCGITRADNVFSGSLTMQHSPCDRNHFEAAKISLFSGFSFIVPLHLHFKSDCYTSGDTLLGRRPRHINLLPGCWKRMHW